MAPWRGPTWLVIWLARLRSVRRPARNDRAELIRCPYRAPAPDRLPDVRRARPGDHSAPSSPGSRAQALPAPSRGPPRVEQVPRERAPAIMRREGGDPSTLGEVAQAVIDRLFGEPARQHTPTAVNG
jgi:hypothetical protein